MTGRSSTAAACPKEVMRWIRLSKNMISRVEAARQKKLPTHVATTTSVPNDQPKPRAHFVAILNNSAFQSTEFHKIFKESFPVFKNIAPQHAKMAGLIVPQECFGTDKKIWIVVYYLTEKVARDLNLRVTKKVRKRKRMTNTIEHQQKELIVVPVICESDRQRTSTSSDVEIIDLVSSDESMEVDSLSSPTDLIQNLTNETNLQAPVLQTFVPPNQSWQPFDPLLELPTANIRYRKTAWTKWPVWHPLLKIANLDKTKGPEAVLLLKESILAQCIRQSKINSALDVKLNLSEFANELQSFDAILLQVVKFHQKYKNLHLFTRSCIAFCSSSFKLKANSTPTQVCEQKKKFMSQKLQEAVLPKCILSTLMHMLRLSGLDKLLGSKSNIKGFFNFVKRAVFLGGLMSTLQLNHLMTSMSHAKCDWMNEKIDNVLVRQWLLAKISTWMFNEYILVILRTSFYITESSESRQEMTFYLRNTWISVTDKLKSHYLNSGQLVKIGQQQEFPITGKLRFIPKTNNTVRTILNYKPPMAESNVQGAKKFLIYLSTQVAPHGIGDTTSLHVRWGRFLKEWAQANHPKLFFVRMDIADAFPSVKLDKLRHVIEIIETDEEQLYLKHYKYYNSKRQSTKMYSFAGKRNDPTPLFIQNRPWNTYRPCGMGLFDKDGAYTFIRSALVPNTLRLGNCKFSFLNGLPQGWSLSQHLCNIYYGSIDNEYLAKFLNVKGEFFTRNVDDYFFVTPDAQRAVELVDLLKQENNYGFTMNESKTKTNTTVRSDDNIDDPSLHQVTFFGWKFCLLTGHVSRDFSRYAGLDMSCTLSFLFKDNISCEEFIRRRLLYFTPLRLYPLIFDPALNCWRRILMSVMEAGLMIAFRFYAMCRTLYSDLSLLTTDTSKINALYRALCLCAGNLVRFLQSISRQNLRNTSALYNCSKETPCNTCHADCRSKFLVPSDSAVTAEPVNPKIINGVTRSECHFVIFHAFIIKLSKHHAVFHKYGEKSENVDEPEIKQSGLLSLLRYKRKIYQARIHETRLKEILSAVGTALPPHFALMKK